MSLELELELSANQRRLQMAAFNPKPSATQRLSPNLAPRAGCGRRVNVRDCKRVCPREHDPTVGAQRWERRQTLGIRLGVLRAVKRASRTPQAQGCQAVEVPRVTDSVKLKRLVTPSILCGPSGMARVPAEASKPSIRGPLARRNM